MRQAVLAGYIEDLQIPQAPLDVLAQVLLGMAVERPHNIEEAWELVLAAGPYLNLTRPDFDAALNYLAGGGQVLARFGKIVIEDGTFKVASAKLAREYFQSIGTISEDFRVRIVTKNYRRLGEVEEGFLTSLRPGEAFSMAGKAVEVESLHGAIAVVKPSNSDRVTTPRWMGGQRHRPPNGRRTKSSASGATCAPPGSEGGRPNIEFVLRDVYQATMAQAELAAEFIARQYHAAPIPIDDPIQSNSSPAPNAASSWSTASPDAPSINRSPGSPPTASPRAKAWFPIATTTATCSFLATKSTSVNPPSAVPTIPIAS